jgi:hypothetical protein
MLGFLLLLGGMLALYALHAGTETTYHRWSADRSRGNPARVEAVAKSLRHSAGEKGQARSFWSASTVCAGSGRRV